MSGVELTLESRTEEGWAVVAADGEIDLSTSPRLRRAITRCIEDGHRRVVVDLRKVRFMDSSGLGVLVSALKDLKERDGSLALVCDQGPVRRVLSITGLDERFPLYATVAEATVAADDGG